MTKETWVNVKRYALSSLISFSAGFVVVILANHDSFTLASFQDGSVIGIVFLAVRAGAKLVLEGFLSWYTGRKAANLTN